MKILVVVHGFLGDILLSQPAAKLLKEEGQATQVDFLIGFPQPYLLLDNNPYIDNVFLSKNVGQTPQYDHLKGKYDDIRVVKNYDGSSPLSIHHQLSVGVKNPTASYEIYTLPKYDEHIKKEFSKLSSKPIIGVGLTWKVSSRGEHFPSNTLIKHLSKKYHIVSIGRLPSNSQLSIAKNEQSELTYAFEASKCKYVDIMLGSEGGLTNLAAGVGTKVIYTTDFMWNLAGPNGTHYQHPNPLEILGPKAYFADKDHIALPYDIQPKKYIETIETILDDIYK